MLVLIIFFIWVDTGLEIHLPKPLTKERRKLVIKGDDDYFKFNS
ncbi:hypothetical protein BOH78_0045 [Pichia kudriavzevii]|uniref:Uncharacterized protein n=1 Tax=Pichia kudriavzevii TaxID=4909 RepID=A0A1V2LU72_PICKU|nr:hypothetical protein BOH78_0045 [Pichia kudriavzevii]